MRVPKTPTPTRRKLLASLAVTLPAGVLLPPPAAAIVNSAATPAAATLGKPASAASVAAVANSAATNFTALGKSVSSPSQPRKLSTEEIEARRLAKLKKIADSAPANVTTSVKPASEKLIGSENEKPIAERQTRRRVKGEDADTGGTIVVGEDAKGRGWYEYVEFGSRRFRTRKISDEEIFITSLAAGAAVDLIKVAALHPIDTARARAQWNGKGLVMEAGSVWAGLGPAIATSGAYMGFQPALVTATELLCC